MENRRIIYYIPAIRIPEVIQFNNFRLRPFKKDHGFADLLPLDIFDGKGTLVEVNGFKSGDKLDGDISSKTYETMEQIKFGYFFAYPSHSDSFFGFIYAELFDYFEIIEKDPDPSVEHKTIAHNGVSSFLISTTDYYSSRLSLHRPLSIQFSEMIAHLDYFADSVKDSRHFMAMRLFNRCWSLHSVHSYFEKVLWAKVSIDILLESCGVSKKEVSRIFLDKALHHIQEQSKSSHMVLYIKKIISVNGAHKDDMLKALEKNLRNLKEARDKIAHEGLVDKDHINIPFYLIWLPLLWMVLLCPEKITEKEGVRLALFLGLLKFDPKDWQQSDDKKHSHLYQYDYLSRVIPEYLKKQRCTEKYEYHNDLNKAVDAVKESIALWLTR